MGEERPCKRQNIGQDRSNNVQDQSLPLNITKVDEDVTMTEPENRTQSINRVEQQLENKALNPENSLTSIKLEVEDSYPIIDVDGEGSSINHILNQLQQEGPESSQEEL